MAPAVATTVSFSGAGHLLSYQLGAASVLFQASIQNRLPPIRAVSGSSSGAIAAAVVAFMPHQIEDYAHRFIQDRGKAFENFQHFLKTANSTGRGEVAGHPELHICVTKSNDGTPHLIHFDVPPLSSSQTEPLFRAIQASCRIPVSFHPLDLFTSSLSYEGEGIDIDGTHYVDGGISGIFPPPVDLDARSHRILVSPVALKLVDNSQQHSIIHPGRDMDFFLWGPKTRDGMVRIVPSVANLRASLVSAGFASTDALSMWYSRGKQDATRFLETA